MRNNACFLITGATGLIGSALVRLLLEQYDGIQLILPVRNRSKAEAMFGRDARVSIVECDLLSMNIANYEGMCLGPTLNDGRMVLLLVSDSQDNYGNSIYHLKDYIMSVIIDAPAKQASGEE